MGRLDEMGAAAPALAQEESAEQGSSARPNQTYTDLILGWIAAVGIGGTVLALVTGSISSADAAMIFGAIVGLVVLFAVLKLFTIAATLKEILAELRKE